MIKMIEAGELKRVMREILADVLEPERALVMHVERAIDSGDLDASPPQGWLAVSERLPEQKGKYLTLHEGNGMCVDYWFGGRFGDFFAGDITHWMELPPPPQPGLDK